MDKRTGRHSSVWRSLRCATKGLWEAVASERNVKIQLAVALLNVIAGETLKKLGAE